MQNRSVMLAGHAWQKRSRFAQSALTRIATQQINSNSRPHGKTGFFYPYMLNSKRSFSDWSLSASNTDSLAPTSSIRIPVKIGLYEIKQRFEQEFPSGTRLFDQSGIDVGDKKSLQIVVTKHGSIDVTVNNDGTLNISLPVEIYARVDWYKNVFGVMVRKHEDTTFKITIHTSVNVAIQNDWTMQSVVNSGWSWNEKPYLEFLGIIRVRISDIVGKALDSQIPKLTNKLSDYLNSGFNTRQLLINIWNKLPRSFKIFENPQAFLIIAIFEMAASKFYRQEGDLCIDAYAGSKMLVTVGEKPTELSLIPLPDKKEQIPNDSIRILIPIELSHSAAIKTIKADYSNKDFGSQNVSGMLANIKTGEIDVKFSNKSITFTVPLIFNTIINNIEAELTFEAVPEFDNTNISLKPLSTDIIFFTRLGNSTIRTSATILRDHLKKKIEENLTFEYRTKANELREEATTHINEFSNDHFSLHADLGNINIDKTEVTPEKLVAILSLFGNATAKINVETVSNNRPQQ